MSETNFHNFETISRFSEPKQGKTGTDSAQSETTSLDERFYQAAVRGEQKDCEALLAAGAAVDFQEPRRGSSEGNNALHGAIVNQFSTRKKAAFLAWLIDTGIDVDQRNAAGRTPLHEAAEKGDARAVTVLLRAGADPSLRCADGMTAEQLGGRSFHNRAVTEAFSVHAARVRLDHLLQLVPSGGTARAE